MFTDDDLIPISGLQHVVFCERQFGLIHIEQLWAENRFTAEGDALHERVDKVHSESRRLFKQEYGMSIRSLRFGLIGKCDLVELYLDSAGGIADANPVEFKRGKNKETHCDRVQLCAQAICLEEMFGITVTGGDFYYLGTHRRVHAEFDAGIREVTHNAINRAREILASESTPTAFYEAVKCDRCSMIDLCMPKAVGEGGKRVDRYMQTSIFSMRKECDK